MNKQWHNFDKITAIEELKSDAVSGLSSATAALRRAEFGPNELVREEKASAFSIFLGQFKNILIIILIAATGLSLLVGETVDAIIIAVIVVFSAVLGFVQEYRAEKALDALKKMLSMTITIVRDGSEREVDAKEIVPGDIMILEAGDKIPADARIIESNSLMCDESSLTGESEAVHKIVDVVAGDVEIGDQTNMVFTGCSVTYGRGRAVVTSTAMKTEFGKIAGEVSKVKTDKTPLEKRTEEIGKWLGIVALAVCVLVVVVSVLRRKFEGGSLDLPFLVGITMFGVSLAVAAVPEAMAAIVTGALAIGMRDMAKRNALVRKMPAVETLGCTTVICSDKTGTITKGEMTIKSLFAHDIFYDVSGVGYAPVGEVSSDGKRAVELSPAMTLLEYGSLCNDASLFHDGSKWVIKGDPTEAAILVAAKKAGIDYEAIKALCKRTMELPFSSDRKLMTTVHKMPDGKIAAIMKGAPEVVLGCCTSFWTHGSSSAEMADKVHEANAKMAGSALRVIAVAYRVLESEPHSDDFSIESGMTLIGLMGMMDPPRPEVIDAVKTCRDVGIKPVMITGDHKLTAIAVAREVGIFQEGDIALTGDDLRKMAEGELDGIVHKVSVYARVSPMDKLMIVKAWQHRGDVVAMTGDGVNDAPALKHADIGIAMGITGTEVTKEAADVVLTDDNFATIVIAVERGRWIYDNIKKYLTFLLRCNITEVVVLGGVALVLGPDFMPLLPAAILYVNLATDGLPALALGISPPEPDIMKRPPRNPKESVFSKDVLTFLGFALFLESPLFLWVFLRNRHDMMLARTDVFFMFIIVELAIALSFSSMRYSIFKVRPHKWLVISILWEVLLVSVIIQFPVMRKAFEIDLPSWDAIGMICLISLAAIISIELAKIYIRRADIVKIKA